LLVVIGRSNGGNRAELAEPLHQFCETRAIFLADGGEFQPQSTTGMYMADNRFSPDLPFFDEKINACLRAYGF